jgi:hypothetical protein
MIWLTHPSCLFDLVVTKQKKEYQCLALKSRKEPLTGVGTRLFGVVASQIIFDKLRSIGIMLIASRNKAKNARANMKSMPAEMRIASRITGITTPRKIIIYTFFSIHDEFKNESDH